MGDRLKTFNSQTILEQRHLAATDCNISTGRAGLTAIVQISCATPPPSRADKLPEQYCAFANQPVCSMNECKILYRLKDANSIKGVLSCLFLNNRMTSLFPV